MNYNNKPKPSIKRNELLPPLAPIIEDNIVKEVREDLLRRSKAGIKKYGVTLDRDDLSLLEWHQHAYEEQLDNILYTKKIITMLKNEKT
jgi:hypothetical protein